MIAAIDVGSLSHWWKSIVLGELNPMHDVSGYEHMGEIA